MTATAEAYGFGARAPYAQMRESEYDMKQRVRLSGLFPRVRNDPMTVQLQALLKEFDKNAALAGILERRRRMEEKTQYDLRSREAAAALNTNLAPPFRTGTASFATSAAVAEKVADIPDAADVMTGSMKPAVLTAAASAARSANAAAKKKAQQKSGAAAGTAGTLSEPEVIIGGVSLQGGSVSSTDVLSSKPAAKKPAKTDRSPSTSRKKAV